MQYETNENAVAVRTGGGWVLKKICDTSGAENAVAVRAGAGWVWTPVGLVGESENALAVRAGAGNILVPVGCESESESGCTGDDDEGIAGPCYHENLSPVVEVASVTDRATGEELDAFRITQVTIAGRAWPLAEFTRAPSYGVELAGDVLACTVPCGFGKVEGSYVVVVSAAGYLPEAIAFDARYADCWGECPSFCEGPTMITVALTAR